MWQCFLFSQKKVFQILPNGSRATDPDSKDPFTEYESGSLSKVKQNHILRLCYFKNLQSVKVKPGKNTAKN